MECFTVLADEIEGRIDSFYYKPEFREFDKKIHNKWSKLKRINEISKVICGPFGSSIMVKDYKPEGVPLIRISNIDEDHLSKRDIIFISKDLSEKLKSYIVKKGDIIISQRGTLGLAVQVDDSFDGAVISANFIAVKNLKEISPGFLQIILSSKLGQMQLIRKTSGQVQTKITTEDIKTIEIPIIPENKQKEIIDKIKDGYKLKSKKESESQKLLDSLNDYVLDELGIKLPELKDKIAYVINSDETNSKRIDAYYYQPKFEEVEKAIKKGKFELVKIGDTLKYYKKGVEVGSDAYIDEGIPFIRVSDIDDYKISYEKTDKKISTQLYNQLMDYNPKKDELLYSKDGSIGFCVVVNEDKKAIISGGILRLKVKENVNNFYVKSILCNKFFKILFDRESIGSIIKHLTPEVFISFKIPLPPLSIQNKIAEEVKRRMQKAEQLQKEAKEDLERAKQEVERIILGD